MPKSEHEKKHERELFLDIQDYNFLVSAIDEWHWDAKNDQGRR